MDDYDVEIDGHVFGETEHSYRFYDGARYVWLPKEYCAWDEDEKVMTMPGWLAVDKELV